jgi:PKD repeat protein
MSITRGCFVKLCLQKLALAVIVLFAGVQPALAQTYPYPAKSTAAPAKCVGCLGANSSGQLNAGLATWPFSTPLVNHVGRTCDSTSVTDYQYGTGFATARARIVRIVRTQHGSAPPRAYIQMGSAIGVYSLDRFFTTELPGGLTSISTVVGTRVDRKNDPLEKVLQWDAWISPQASGSGWAVSYTDGQDKLFDFDVDDRGYVYVATGDFFGWGLVRDDGGTTGVSMPLVDGSQFNGDRLEVALSPTRTAHFTPDHVMAVKAGGRYYAVSGGDGGRRVYDTTLPAAIVPAGYKEGLANGFNSFARDDARERVAIATMDGTIQIFDATTFVNGGSPINSFTAPLGKSYRDVTVDENGNFWTAERTNAPSNNQLIEFERGTTGYTRHSFDVFGEPFTPQPNIGEGLMTINYGDKYLAVTGRVNAGAGSDNDVKLFKIEGGVPIPVSLGNFFAKYYYKAPRDYAQPGNIGRTMGAYPIKWNNKQYLIYNTQGLGDVFELQGGDSIAVGQKPGTFGTLNVYSKATVAGPYYGDLMKFTAQSSSATSYALTWDFDNTESGSDNTQAGNTGTDGSHQFSGLDTAAKILTVRHVKATANVNAEVNGSVNVTLAVPTARIGIAGTTTASSTDGAALDVVAGDQITDASDGNVEGHYSAWTLDATTTNQAPDVPLAAPAVGPHTLTLAAKYGKYTPSFVTNGAAYVDSVSSIALTVRPFVIAFKDPTTSGTIVTFKGSGRATQLTSILSASTWTVDWSLKSGQTDVVPPQSSSASVGTIPDFAIPDRSAIPSGSVLQLKVTVANGLGTGVPAEYASQTITQTLLTPDPKITKTGCDSTSSTCTFTIGSIHPYPTTDWTVTWTLKTGNSSSQISIYTSCTTCDPGTTVTMHAESFANTYVFTGCEEYSWTFGDGGTLTSTNYNVTHKYTTSGNYTIRLTIKKGTQTSPQFSQPITIGQIVIPCSAPASIHVEYYGNKGCQTGTACKTTEIVTFNAFRGSSPLLSCDATSWTYSDGGGSSNPAPSHTFTTAGSYTASVNVFNNSGQAAGSVSLTIVADDNTGPCSAPPNADAVYVDFLGASSGCTLLNGKICTAGEQIKFTVRPYLGTTIQVCNKYEWNFGDNSALSTATEPLHSFVGGVSAYHVKARIYNTSNNTGNIIPVDVPFQSVPVKPIPNLSFSSFQSNGTKGNVVTFTVTSDISATGWTWNFGDGQTDNTKAGEVGTTSTNTHTYANKGSFTITVKARNSQDTSTAPVSQVDRPIAIDDIPEYRYLLPVVAHAAGIGSVWRTDVQIYTADSAVSPSNPLLLTASYKGVNYPLNMRSSTMIISDILNELRPGVTEQGSMLITIKTQIAPQIWSRTYNQTADGTFGQFIPAILLNEAGNGGAVGEGKYYLAGLRSNGRYRTNIGLVNPNDQAITAIVRLYDDTGLPVGQALSHPLQPFQLDQFQVTGPTDRPFSVEVEVPAGTWVIGYASLIDGGSSDPVYIQAIRQSELGSTDYRDSVLPGVGHVGAWRSDVTIYNPNGRIVTVDLAYYDAAGTKQAEAKNVPINAGQFLQYGDVLRQGIFGNVADGVGMLRVTVPAAVSADYFPLVFARTYNDNGSNKTYGQGIAGFANVRANVKAGHSALVPAVRSDEKYYTNVGLTNVSSTPVTATVKVLDPNTGEVARSISYPMQPNESIVATQFDLAGRASASLKIEVTGGNIWAFASIIDKGTSDPEYVPATPLP